jgi:hypothetical protein
MKLNVVYGLGPFYWILRDNGVKKMPVVSSGWVHELGGYWRKGKGMQVRISKYVFQVGICKKPQKKMDEQDGLLYALDGRMMDVKSQEIGDWK